MWVTSVCYYFPYITYQKCGLLSKTTHNLVCVNYLPIARQMRLDKCIVQILYSQALLRKIHELKGAPANETEASNPVAQKPNVILGFMKKSDTSKAKVITQFNTSLVSLQLQFCIWFSMLQKNVLMTRNSMWLMEPIFPYSIILSPQLVEFSAFQLHHSCQGLSFFISEIHRVAIFQNQSTDVSWTAVPAGCCACFSLPMLQILLGCQFYYKRKEKEKHCTEWICGNL